MNFFERKFSRRDFLKMSLAGMGALALRPWRYWVQLAADFPEAKKLGRVLTKLELKASPSQDSKTVGVLYDDAIVVWLREVIGAPFPMFPTNRRWIETPDGYLPAPLVQPVLNQPNEVQQTLPLGASGERGFWAEVTVPFAPFYLVNPNPASPHLKETPADRYRVYYSQVYWIDDVRQNSLGTWLYRVREKHGSYGDVFWSPAEAFRPLSAEDVSPIRPEVTDKLVVIDLTKQTLSCLESGTEVHFCRISSGAKFDASGNAVDKWSTPVGTNHVINRKFISLHMAGGSAASGYELMAIAWTSIFASGGVAIHSTYWHNNYGEPMSHGCVNAMPEDARFVWRWSLPVVPYEDGKMEVTGYNNVTRVNVIES